MLLLVIGVKGGFLRAEAYRHSASKSVPIQNPLIQVAASRDRPPTSVPSPIHDRPPVPGNRPQSDNAQRFDHVHSSARARE